MSRHSSSNTISLKLRLTKHDSCPDTHDHTTSFAVQIWFSTTITVDLSSLTIVFTGHLPPIGIHTRCVKYVFNRLEGTPVNIIVGSHVWMEDPALAWIDGQVTKLNGAEVEIQTTDGKKVVGSLQIINIHFYKAVLVPHLCSQLSVLVA